MRFPETGKVSARHEVRTAYSTKVTLADAFPGLGSAKFHCDIEPHSEATATVVREQAGVDRPQR